MSEILHANIFFLITAIAVVVLTILLSVALYYVVGILRNIRNITGRVERGSEVLGKDLLDLRKSVEQDGVRFRHIINFFGKRAGWFPQEKAQRKTRKVKEEKEGTTS